jgi:hypothetical protein
MTDPDHYAVLGIGRGATPDEVRRAYLRAARATHPDSGGSATAFHVVQEAWHILSDPGLRQVYDRDLDGISDWEALGWGPDDASAERASPPPPARPRPAQSAPARPEDSPAVPWNGWRDAHAEDQPGLDGSSDAPLDAFRSGPRPLPDPLTTPIPSIPKPARNRWRTAGIVAVLVLGVLPVVVVAVVAAGPTGFPLLLVGAVWAQRAFKPREDPAEVAAMLLRNPEARIERHRRAEAWNTVLRAQVTSGAAIRQLGSAALDGHGIVVPGRRWTRDPLTQGEEVRAIGPHLPDGTWIAIDGSGRVLATAPLGGPQAWLEILRSLAW